MLLAKEGAPAFEAKIGSVVLKERATKAGFDSKKEKSYGTSKKPKSYPYLLFLTIKILMGWKLMRCSLK